MIKVKVLKQDKRIGMRKPGTFFLASNHDAEVWESIGIVSDPSKPVIRQKKKSKKSKSSK